ncbi:MAG TPA: hypothetical protein VIL03_01740 [Clostridia bacterium]|jgi:hypothetical protein
MNKTLKNIIKWSVIVLSILLILLILLLMIGGLFVTPNYLSPWDKKYYNIYQDPRLRILAIGILAPSAHNMQHWHFELPDDDPNKIGIYADPERFLENDPTHREMMISIGTLLEYLNIAAKKQGHGLDLKLFPKGPLDEENFASSLSEKPIAEITINHEPDLKGVELYDNLFIQDTNRYEYVTTPLSQSEINLFRELNDFEDLEIKFYSQPEERATIKELALKGLSIIDNTPRLSKEYKEITRKNERQKNAKSYGFSVETQGVKNWFVKYFLQGVMTVAPFLPTDKMRAKMTQDMYQKLYSSTPTFMCIVCPTDKINDREVQVNCGRLYSRLILTGHTLKIGFHPMSSVIADYPEAHLVKGEFMTKFLSSNEYPLMLTRVGMITKPFPHSMREYALDHVR